MAVGGAQHPGVVLLASRRRHAAFWRERSRTGRSCCLRCGALRPVGGCASGRSAFHPIPGLDAIALTGYPDFSTWQPFLDEIITHPAADAFRAAHNFRRTIEIPGFHVTSWFDIFQTSVLAAFNDIQSRAGNQKLWIGPNEHYFVYHHNFWPRDPYFAWFDYWLKGEPTGIMDEPSVYYSPRAWVDDREAYSPAEWRYAERWPPPEASPQRLYLRGDGTLGADGPSS